MRKGLGQKCPKPFFCDGENVEAPLAGIGPAHQFNGLSFSCVDPNWIAKRRRNNSSSDCGIPLAAAVGVIADAVYSRHGNLTIGLRV
jgi:hypothetical protein